MKTLLRLAVFLFCLGGVAVAALYGWLTRPLTLPVTAGTVEFRIPAGTSLRGVATILAEAGINAQPDLLAFAMFLKRWRGGGPHIRTGTYGITAGTTPWELLDILVAGRVLQMDVRLVEGWTFRQWRARLRQQAGLAHELERLSDAEVMARLNLAGTSPEGAFFPDTYRVDLHASDLELLGLAAQTLQKHLRREWAARQDGLPYRTPYEALIVASIVEKETGIDADRPMVASVFVNRLRLGMRLQTDPTVIYGLGDAFDGNLRRRDLETDTPYNTYTRAGLPPTPIAMPGLASIRAALHPARTRHLYFVARGDGSSAFSETLEEHNQAVNRFQRGQR
ncbi:MAG: endolytic transglycosylase MltG [Zoogloeaceae bacterium]|nr:endolytic transglycosylase MltG [Zoogloeaceae bacterium]